nr:AMP-binding protein [Tepidiformaceae bacterium]
MAETKEIGLPVHERYSPPARVREGALVGSLAEYQALYDRSIADPDGFWSDMANRHLEWMAPFGKVREENLPAGDIKWFLGGKLNVSVNCLDRHLATRGDRVALLLEGDEPGTNRSMTYREMHAEVCRLANYLRSRGVGKGDRVAIYMGMVPELAVAMLACARIGAVHSVIFGGFSP